MNLEEMLSGVSEEANRGFLNAMDNATYRDLALPPTAPDPHERSARAIDLATAAANGMYKEGLSRDRDAALILKNAYKWHQLQSLARGTNATSEGHSPIPEEIRASLPVHANAMLSAGILTYCVPREGDRLFTREEWEETTPYEKTGQLITAGIGFMEGLHRKHYDSEPDLPVESFRDDAKKGKVRYHLRQKVAAEDDAIQLASLLENLKRASGSLNDEVIEELIKEKSQGIILSGHEIGKIERTYGQDIAREMAPLHYDHLDRIEQDKESQTDLFS